MQLVVDGAAAADREPLPRQLEVLAEPSLRGAERLHDPADNTQHDGVQHGTDLLEHEALPTMSSPQTSSEKKHGCFRS